MRRFCLLSACMLCVSAVAFPEPASAQARPGYRPGGPVPNRPPTLSPYLNLLRGGSPAANYYLGVKPERARRADEAALGQLEQDFYARPPAPLPVEGEERLLPSSGHPTYFMNYSHYYGPGVPGTPGPGPARGPRGPVR